MHKKLRAGATALVIAAAIAAASATATAEPMPAPERQEVMAGFSAPPCLPLILPPAVNVNAFLICLA